MDIKSIAFSDSGLARNENEDSIYAFKKENCAIFLVADGMGGCENGKNASDTIVKHVAKYVEMDMDRIKDAKKQFGKVYDANTFFTDIRNCLLNANKEIYGNYTVKGHTSGSTLVMIAIYDSSYKIFWAGDSHIYQVVAGDLQALTVDDVWENDKKRIEGLTIDEVRKNPNYGRLTNAFGTIENVNIHVTEGILYKGMKFFLCSDGIYKYCDKKKLKSIVTDEKLDDKEFCKVIKEEAYKSGAPDNLSFVYVENKEGVEKNTEEIKTDSKNDDKDKTISVKGNV